jgi:MFS family permease
MEWSKIRRTVFSPFVLQLLAIMFIIEFVKGALLLTFLPLYLQDVLNASTVVIGWTLAVQYIGDNLFRTPIGWLIDRIGYRTSMLIGVLSTLASVVILATARDFTFIVVACGLLGVGTAPLWPCVIIGTTEIAGKEGSGTIMSIVYIAWLSGAGLGPFASTFAFSHYTLAFRILFGLIVLVLFIAVFLPGKTKKPAHRGAGSRGEHHAARLRLSRKQRAAQYLSEVKRSLTVSPVIFPAMFAQTFALGLLTPILTIYAKKDLMLTDTEFRGFLLAGGAVTVLGMIPVGRLVDRWGFKRFLVIGLTIGSATLLAFTSFTAVPVLYALVAMLGFAYALIIPSWNALLATAIPPEKRGAIWGFFLTIEGTGTTVGPLISGVLSHSFSHRTPFIVSGAVLFLLLLLQFFIRIKPAGKRASTS